MALKAYHKYPGERGEPLVAIPLRQYEMLITIRDMFSAKMEEEGKNLNGNQHGTWQKDSD